MNVAEHESARARAEERACGEFMVETTRSRDHARPKGNASSIPADAKPPSRSSREQRERRRSDKWLRPLELRDVISELANDLYDFKNWEIGEYSENTEINERIWQKYPGF
jgi:hypothetical protein